MPQLWTGPTLLTLSGRRRPTIPCHARLLHAVAPRTGGLYVRCMGRGVIGNLQVLRGVSALAVAISHAQFGFHFPVQPVSTFFVISGFIMCFISEKETGHFFERRVIRIGPFYWVCTAAYLIVMYRWAFLRPWGWHSDFAAKFIQGVLFIPTDELPPLGVGWTLNLEMYFYATFALSLALHRRIAPFIVAAVIIAVMALHAHGCALTVCSAYSVGYVAYFIAGIVLFYLWRQAGSVLPVWFAWLGGSSVLIACYAGWMPLSADVLPVLVVGAALCMTAAGADVQWWPVLLVGDASYAIYLTHLIVLELIGRYAPAISQEVTPVRVVAVVAACIGFGILTHLVIEKPLYRWLLTRSRRRWERQSAAAARRGLTSSPIAGADHAGSLS